MKQIYMLRNEAIRNNAIDAILTSDRRQVTLTKSTLKNPCGAILKTALCGRYCRTYHVRCFGMERDLRRRTGKICSLPCGLRPKLEQRSAPGIDGGVVMLGVRTSKMRKASMTELIEIMFWFGSERNVRWSDDSRREYEWSQRKGRAA